MPQALPDILAQLDTVYNPQKQTVQKQIDALPAEQQAQMQGLDQAKANAFGDINVQANDRNLSYSGMPIQEQAKYTGATYLPAVASLKSTYANKGFALQSALQQLEADRVKQAQGIYTSQANAEADAAAKVQAARISAAANPGLGFGLAAGSTPAGQTSTVPSPQDQAMSVIQHYLTADYATRWNPGFTERTLIPRLQHDYPQLAAQIPAMVYNYRKQFDAPTAATGGPAPTNMLTPGMNAYGGH